MAIGGELKVLYIGRLTFQKNVFVLIEAISLVQNRKVSLTIVGEGPDLNALKSLTQSLNVDAVFHNFQENLTPYFTNSDVLCLPSRWEGFPNVIAEAMSHGMPAIGFKDCAGVSSLIKSKVNGELVDGIDSAESLSFVLSAFEVADYLPSEIQKSVEVFDRALFSSQWQKAVDASVYHRRK